MIDGLLPGVSQLADFGLAAPVAIFGRPSLFRVLLVGAAEELFSGALDAIYSAFAEEDVSVGVLLSVEGGGIVDGAGVGKASAQFPL